MFCPVTAVLLLDVLLYDTQNCCNSVAYQETPCSKITPVWFNINNLNSDEHLGVIAVTCVEVIRHGSKSIDCLFNFTNLLTCFYPDPNCMLSLSLVFLSASSYILKYLPLVPCIGFVIFILIFKDVML